MANQDTVPWNRSKKKKSHNKNEISLYNKLKQISINPSIYPTTKMEVLSQEFKSKIILAPVRHRVVIVTQTSIQNRKDPNIY